MSVMAIIAIMAIMALTATVAILANDSASIPRCLSERGEDAGFNV